MDDWIDYYDSTHTIYASKRHRDLHFAVIAHDIVGYITSKDAVVLDYSCGEALSAAIVAEACGQLILAEPAPGVRGRLIARFAPNTKIRVRSLEDVRKMHERSIDLVVMNSVVQYMTPQELDAALAVIGREGVRVHDLRHYAGTMATLAGATLAEVMARLGHSTTKAAMLYQQVASGRAEEIAAGLSRLTEGEGR